MKAALTAGLAAAVCALTLVGCASTDARYSTDDGWHLAVVTRLGNALPSPNPAVQDCRPAAPSAAGTDARYAEVAYHLFRRARVRIALLPQRSTYAVGDSVYVNVHDCTLPLAPALPAR
ncbi:hypothetical protein ACSFA8_03365 [Variovorax sp. RT4R15]|uniref:hypothetical protein n=1 Tax=Variovorax sp. RT4R15 TaxID=3443737 RepID=UPI003F4521EA